MAKKLLSRQGGFVHDIGVVSSLSDEPNNIRLLSDRSLYILQNLSQAEITYLSRYGEILTGDFYLPVLAGTPEESDVQDAVDIIRRDLNSMGVEELLECICANLTAISEQAEAGAEADRGLADGSTVSVGDRQGPEPFGLGQQFPDASAYLDAKCNTANGIFDTVAGAVDWLEQNGVEAKLGLFGGVSAAIFLALTFTGPVGWVMVATGSIISSVTVYFFRNVFNFSNMQDALTNTKEECVKALYNSSTATVARDGFIAAIEAGVVTLSSAEKQLIRLMLAGDVVNQLFVPREDVAVYDPPSPIDCGGFILEVWTFAADVEGWTFRDDSNNNGTAGMSHDAPSQALAMEMDMDGGFVGTKAIAVGISPTVSIAVDVGNSVQLDYSGPLENSYETWKTIKVFFGDATTAETTAINSTAGTVVLDIVEAKTITKVEAKTTLYSGVTSFELHEIINLFEVRIQ